jgi:homoserine kinase
MNRTVQAVVPGSTSNLGPGFDLFGLALDLYLRLKVEVEGEFVMATAARTEWELTWAGEGSGPPAAVPLDEENLAVRGLKKVWETTGVGVDGRVRVQARSEIPVARGLGSSATAFVAGLLAGEALAEADLGKERLLALAAAEEGHPDNAAPALYGGLVAAAPLPGGDHILTQRGLLFEKYLLGVCIPERTLNTRLAREALPASIPHREAVAGQQRAFFLFQGLTEGCTWALRELVRDVLHQPYRAPLVPAFDDLVERAYECGAHAVWLSGSGPALCWLVEGPLEQVETIGAALVLRWHQEGIAARTQVLAPDNWGGAVHEVD